MNNLIKNQRGLNIVGQGGKIILFMLPFLIAAIAVDTYLHGVAALPEGIAFVRVIGYVLLLPGLLLWSAAMAALLSGFPKGRLVTTGAYGVVRNPLYSSVTFFILPAVTLITRTWVYLAPAVFLYIGVMLFIPKEEKGLLKAFGGEYEAYLKKVDRMIPFRKPR